MHEVFQCNFDNFLNFLKTSGAIYKEGDKSEYEVGLNCFSFAYICGNNLKPFDFLFFDEETLKLVEMDCKHVKNIAKFYLEYFEKDDRPQIQFHNLVLKLSLLETDPKGFEIIEELIYKAKEFKKQDKSQLIEQIFPNKKTKIEKIEGKEKFIVHYSLKDQKLVKLILWNKFKNISEIIGYLYCIRTNFKLIELQDENFYTTIMNNKVYFTKICKESNDYSSAIENLLALQEIYVLDHNFENAIKISQRILKIFDSNHPNYSDFYYNYLLSLLVSLNMLIDPEKQKILFPNITEEDKKLEPRELQRKFRVYVEGLYKEQLKRETKNNIDDEYLMNNTKKEEVVKLLNMFVNIKNVVKKITKIVKMNEICANCGKSAKDVKLLKCSNCQQVYYCGLECQKKNWKDHKKQCENFKNQSRTIKFDLIKGEILQVDSLDKK